MYIIGECASVRKGEGGDKREEKVKENGKEEMT